MLLAEPSDRQHRYDSILFSEIIAHNPHLNDMGVLAEKRGQQLNQHVLTPKGTSSLDFTLAMGIWQDSAECFLAGDEDVNIALRPRCFCKTSNELWLDLQGRQDRGL